jgi:hypothetical protein
MCLVGPVCYPSSQQWVTPTAKRLLLLLLIVLQLLQVVLLLVCAAILHLRSTSTSMQLDRSSTIGRADAVNATAHTLAEPVCVLLLMV